MLICTGDRDSFQLVDERHHRDLPDARGLRDGADDPRGGRGALRRPARRATPSSPRSWARPPTTCPASRGWGRARGQVAQPVRRPRQPHRPRRRDHRQGGRGAARAPRRRDPQPPAQRAGLRPRPRARARRPRVAVLGPRRGAQLFDGLEFRVLRDRLLETLPTEEEQAIDDSGLRRSMRVLGDRRAGRLAGRPRLERRAGRHPPVGHWAAGTGDLLALAFATEEGAAYVTTDKLDVDDEEALAAWLKDASKPKVLHDAKGPMLAFAARGLPLAGLDRDTALSAYLARPDQRSYDLADLTVRYLKRELRQGPADDGQLSLEGLDGDVGAGGPGPARPRCCTPARCSTWRPPSTTSSRSAAAPGCSPTSSCRWSTCWPRWSGPASRSTSTTSVRSRTTSPPRSSWPRRRRTRSSARRSTSARPSSCRSCCSTSCRCRRPSGPRPATPPTPTRCRRSTTRPSTRSCSTCCGTAT